MKRLSFLFAAVLLAAPVRANWIYQGVCYDANWEDRAAWYGTPQAETQLKRLAALGVNSLSITPFAHMDDVHRPEIKFRSELDSGLMTDIEHAKALGMSIVLKPHIWSRQFWGGSGEWHGTIGMKTDADWELWFRNYDAMIVAFATIGQAIGADTLVIGLEYVKATKGHDREWRQIIADVRRVYHGKLTYAAHDFDEAEQIGFWSALDFVGVNAYFPLSSRVNPDPAELHEAWRGLADRLRQLSVTNQKPILITEVGYSAVTGAAAAPFQWFPANSEANEREQALCYAAMMDVLDNQPWLAGLFIWKFKISLTPPELSREASEWFFAFQDKMAEKIVEEHFRRRKP